MKRIKLYFMILFLSLSLSACSFSQTASTTPAPRAETTAREEATSNNTTANTNEEMYQKAMALYAEEKFTESYALFTVLGDYKQSQKMADSCVKYMAETSTSADIKETTAAATTTAVLTKPFTEPETTSAHQETTTTREPNNYEWERAALVHTNSYAVSCLMPIDFIPMIETLETDAEADIEIVSAEDANAFLFHCALYEEDCTGITDEYIINDLITSFYESAKPESYIELNQLEIENRRINGKQWIIGAFSYKIHYNLPIVSVRIMGCYSDAYCIAISYAGTYLSADEIDMLVDSFTIEENAVEPSTEEPTEPSPQNGLGIRETNNIQVALQYVKVMPYLPTALGPENVPEDHEVILGFFEFYNPNDLAANIDPSKITCYADGIQVNNVKTYITVVVDGISQYYAEFIEPKYKMLSVQDFEVKKGWNELTFFYGAECKWTIMKDEVGAENYVKKTVFPSTPEHPLTSENQLIYSKNNEYDVRYMGFELYHKADDYFGTGYYAVFKFTIQNNATTSLDTSLMGYQMNAYHNDFFVGDTDYGISDKIDGFINIYDIDSIEPGMTGAVYIAFEIQKESGPIVLYYDDGYITSHFCGCVYAMIE